MVKVKSVKVYSKSAIIQLLFLLVIFVFCGGLILPHEGASNSSIDYSKTKFNTDALSPETVDIIYKSIEQEEYRINKNTVNNGWQSFNRKNSIRSFYSSGSWKMQKNEIENAIFCELELNTLGVFVDGEQMAEPISNPITTSTKFQLNLDHGVFTEQYINSKAGVRQNFIVDWVPWGTEEITVKLSYSGMLAIQTSSQNILFKNEVDSISYSDFKVFDANGKTLIASMELDKENREIHLNALIKGAKFPITIDPIAGSTDLSDADAIVYSGQEFAGLGLSVRGIGDVNGDGYGDIAAGAPGYSNGQSSEGAVFIYHGSSTGVNTVAALRLEENQANSSFGYSLSRIGDADGDGYSDIIVGAYSYDNGQIDEGRAYVYHGSASGLSSTASTILEENQANSFFGFSVSGLGDVNGDGYSDVIVGAYQYDNGQTDEGRAYIYHGSASGISSTSSKTLEENQASSFFGYSVSRVGDVNGDGYSDVIVGAYDYDNGQTNEGRAYVYHGSVSGVSSTASTILEENQANSSFGLSVSGAGDVNGDGYSDVIVGALRYDNGQTDEGTAFIYHGSASGVSNSSSLTLEENLASSEYGVSVASAGDINGDGYADVIVGAYSYSNGDNLEGAAYTYLGSSTGVNSAAFGSIESNQAFAQLGISVSGAGDVNGDGYADIIVGATLYDNGQSDEGIAQVFHGSASGLSTTAAVTLEADQASSSFGVSVKGVGDINGDGYGDVAVGASGFDNGENNEGLVFIYLGSASGLAATADDTLEANQASAQFGRSVSGGDVNGDGYSDVIVGAPFYNNGQCSEGAVFVYHGSESGLSATANTILDINQFFALFGESVDVCGDVNGDGFADLIVGAIFYDNGQSNEGGVFVYHSSASGLSTTAAVQLESNQASSRYGEFVSGAGDLNGDGYADIVVGANRYDNGQSDEGGAFVYYGSESGIISSSLELLELNQASVLLGNGVAGIGDFNGDGYGDLSVGAASYTNGQSNEGGAFMYLGNASGGLRRNIQLFNESTSNPISQANFLADSFNVSLFARSFYGRTKGKLVWETKANGIPFSSASPITNSTAFTEEQGNFSDLGISGTALTNNVVKETGQDIQQTKLRVRIEYDPISSLNGEVFSPWIYPQGYFGTQGFSALPLPIELLHFSANKEGKQVVLKWSTVSETNNDYFIIEHSTDGRNWRVILTEKGGGE